MRIAKTRGLCYPCGRRTHERRRLLMSNLPLTNKDVYEGICIECHKDKVPKPILEEWERRNKPIQSLRSIRRTRKDKKGTNRPRLSRPASERSSANVKWDDSAPILRGGSDPSLLAKTPSLAQEPPSTTTAVTMSAASSMSSMPHGSSSRLSSRLPKSSAAAVPTSVDTGASAGGNHCQFGARQTQNSDTRASRCADHDGTRYNPMRRCAAARQ